MNRLVVVRCPDLLDEDENGDARRLFGRVVEAVEGYCPWVTVVRPGICSLPARGPARYFGGEGALVRLVVESASSLTPVEVGVADGLFAAVLAARSGVVVPAGGTADFLAPFPVDILGQTDLAELLDRLGVRTLGDFAALPESHVLGRFGSDGAAGHRVARGRSGDPGDRHRAGVKRHLRGNGVTAPPPAGQPGFWGGVSDTDARASRALTVVQDLLGPDGVVTAHLQGGRGPAQRARFVTWNSLGAHPDPTSPPGTVSSGGPWPGQIPPPAPAVVYPAPLRAELVGDDGEPLTVSARGLLTGIPCRLSVEQSPWTSVTAWAGPWPSDERWWSRSRRRSARLQTVTGAAAHLLLAERGHWWVEATYG
jgi:hypothetical protein